MKVLRLDRKRGGRSRPGLVRDVAEVERGSQVAATVVGDDQRFRIAAIATEASDDAEGLGAGGLASHAWHHLGGDRGRGGVR